MLEALAIRLIRRARGPAGTHRARGVSVVRRMRQTPRGRRAARVSLRSLLSTASPKAQFPVRCAGGGGAGSGRGHTHEQITVYIRALTLVGK